MAVFAYIIVLAGDTPLCPARIYFYIRPHS